MVHCYLVVFYIKRIIILVEFGGIWGEVRLFGRAGNKGWKLLEMMGRRDGIGSGRNTSYMLMH
jgi:hypothetical protein